MVEIYTDLKAHALVVDPNGAKEGFNGSKIVDEISDADYNFEQTIGNATGELPPPHPGDGNYSLIWNRPPEQFTLEVFPESDMYAFTVYITDQSGERTVIKRYEGTRKAGERIVYDIVYVPEQDFPLSVSRASVR